MAESLSVLCRNLPEFLEAAEGTGHREALEAILDAVRRGEPVTDRLKELGLTEQLESWTVRGDHSGLVNLPGNGGGHVALGHYRCPAQVCRRTEEPRPGEGPPRCAIHRLPLTFDTR